MKKTIHLFIFLGFANVLFGQIGLQMEKSDFSVNQHLWNKHDFFSDVFFPKKNQTNLPVDLKYYFLSSPLPLSHSNYLFGKNNAKTGLAFFCDVEVKLEKSSKIPVRFRLGETQAVDKKEGKWKQF